MLLSNVQKIMVEVSEEVNIHLIYNGVKKCVCIYVVICLCTFACPADYIATILILAKQALMWP